MRTLIVVATVSKTKSAQDFDKGRSRTANDAQENQRNHNPDHGNNRPGQNAGLGGSSISTLRIFDHCSELTQTTGSMLLFRYTMFSGVNGLDQRRD